MNTKLFEAKIEVYSADGADELTANQLEAAHAVMAEIPWGDLVKQLLIEAKVPEKKFTINVEVNVQNE